MPIFVNSQIQKRNCFSNEKVTNTKNYSVCGFINGLRIKKNKKLSIPFRPMHYMSSLKKRCNAMPLNN